MKIYTTISIKQNLLNVLYVKWDGKLFNSAADACKDHEVFSDWTTGEPMIIPCDDYFNNSLELIEYLKKFNCPMNTSILLSIRVL